MKGIWLLLALISSSAFAVEGDVTIYELSVSTDSSWTSIEIRDDAEWVNAPPGKTISVNGRSGIKSYTLSPKKMHLRTMGRGDITLNLFVKSKNSVLGLELCKGKASIHTKQTEERHQTKRLLRKSRLGASAPLNGLILYTKNPAKLGFSFGAIKTADIKKPRTDLGFMGMINVVL